MNFVDSQETQLDVVNVVHKHFEVELKPSAEKKFGKEDTFKKYMLWLAGAFNSGKFKGELIGNTFFVWVPTNKQNQIFAWAMNADAPANVPDNMVQFYQNRLEEGVNDFVSQYKLPYGLRWQKLCVKKMNTHGQVEFYHERTDNGNISTRLIVNKVSNDV